MRLIGYIRVSRVGGRGGDSFISPKEQRSKIAAYAVRPISVGVALRAWLWLPIDGVIRELRGGGYSGR